MAIKNFRATSDSDLRQLEWYVEKVKDTKFRQRFIGAAREFFGHWYNSHSQAERSSDYETEALSVSSLPSLSDSRYGFHFKDTDEFGLYVYFRSDDGKEHKEFFRSNSEFEATINLDHLHIDDPI